MYKFLNLPLLLLTADGAAGAAETVTTSTIMDILTAITSTFSISQIVAMIAGLLGVSMGFVFLWWGVRKGSKMIFKAVKSGKFSI